MADDFGDIWDQDTNFSTLTIQDAGATNTIVVFSFNATAYGAAVAGVITASFQNSATETATGSFTAGSAKIESGTGPGTFAITGMVCGDAGTGEDITFNNAAISSGQDVTMTSFTVTENANFAAP